MKPITMCFVVKSAFGALHLVVWQLIVGHGSNIIVKYLTKLAVHIGGADNFGACSCWGEETGY